MFVGRRSSPVTGLVLAVAIPLVFALGIALRLWLWTVDGPRAELDAIAGWIHAIAAGGPAGADGAGLPIAPVLAGVWAALAAAEPAFLTVTDASDPAIRALVKVPPSLADLGIAAAVGWWFRDRPWAALAAVTALLLWPVTWAVSGWWGRYDALVVLPAVLAVLTARARLPILVAVLAAVSAMTAPAALVFLVPIGAWFLGSQGLKGTLRGLVVAGVTAVLLWLPWVAAGGAGGPGAYLGSLGERLAGVGAALSDGAWNPWWVVQALGNGGDPVEASTAVAGPLAFRDVGYALAGVFGVAVVVGVLRRPTAQGLAAGLAASSLVAFVCLTGRDPADAYPAFVFLLMAINGRTLLAAWGLFAVALAANLLAAAPPAGWALPDDPAIGLVGAAVITLVALIAVLWTGRGERVDPDEVGTPLHSLWPSTR